MEQKDLQELIEREAIRDLMARYFSCCDRLDYDGVLATYAPDAIAIYRGDRCEGHPAIIAKVKGLGNLVSSCHFMGNHTCVIDGDTARTETLALEYLRRPPAALATDLISGLRYTDGLVKRDGKWLIHRRVVAPDWGRIDAVVPAA